MKKKIFFNLKAHDLLTHFKLGTKAFTHWEEKVTQCNEAGSVIYWSFPV